MSKQRSSVKNEKTRKAAAATDVSNFISIFSLTDPSPTGYSITYRESSVTFSIKYFTIH